MTTPQTPTPLRITLSRKKGWKMPPNTVKVCRPGTWGNPFHWQDCADALGEVEAKYDAVRAYARWIAENKTLTKLIPTLRGKNLACWCKQSEPCHAAVLLRLANAALEGGK